MSGNESDLYQNYEKSCFGWIDCESGFCVYTDVGDGHCFCFGFHFGFYLSCENDSEICFEIYSENCFDSSFFLSFLGYSNFDLGFALGFDSGFEICSDSSFYSSFYLSFVSGFDSNFDEGSVLDFDSGSGFYFQK